MKKILFLLGMCLVSGLHAQVVFEKTSSPVYDYLEEMAALGFVDVHSFARPWARTYIAERLQVVESRREELNQRQQRLLNWYLRDYGKALHVGKDWGRRFDLFYYSDSLFRITLNPVIGGELSTNQNGSRYLRTVGAEFQASIGRLGIYGTLTDNSTSEVLAAPDFTTILPGQNYKTITADNRSDFNEMTGGITYQWGWGDVGLVKDRYYWGSSYRSPSVFSGKAPSYAALNLRLYPAKFIEFQYLHGWLISELVDSSRTYLTQYGTRRVSINKNLAANFITIKSSFKTDFTLGNSIIYSDNEFNIAYYIPFMFYKSVDHTYNGTGSNELGQNSQMFADITTRIIPRVRLYTTLFLDELSISNMWDALNHTNLFSVTAGLTWFDMLPNVHFTAEITRTNPWTYRHQIASTTYASNSYNLGHYLGENAAEVYLSLQFEPVARLKLEVAAWDARKGPAHEYEIVHGNANVSGLKFMRYVDWREQGGSATASYELLNDCHIFANAVYLKHIGENQFEPTYYQGNTLTLTGGFRLNF